jgi:hypothetical protein
MTAPTHTPGPWRYSEEELWGAVYGDSHELVATVLPGILDKNKVVATARLIAAAPDLLQACHDALADLDASLRGQPPPIPSIRLALQLREAIKKAGAL